MKKANKLLCLLDYARENVEFYHNILLSELRELNEENIEDIFRKIPIVDKQVIKKNYNQFISNWIREYDLSELFNMKKSFKREYQYRFGNIEIIAEYTSGSSGIPFVTFKTLSERHKLGKDLWKLRNKVAPVVPENFFYFTHTFNDNLYPFPFEAPNTEPDKIIKELDFLEQGDYSWWHSTAYILEYYYNYLLMNQYDFKGLIAIENSGSYISEEEREKYSKIFSCKIANYYGCREVWAMAYDCEEGHLHVNEANILFELVDSNGTLIEEAGEIGYVVITSLCQRSMPFIRYKVGDLGYYMDGECICGNENSRIYILPGRHIIEGTDIYGNKFFKDIISYMILEYNITKFHSISVQQISSKDFIVNIKECREEKNNIEKYFEKSSKITYSQFNYNYIFEYDDSKFSKSIFNVNIKK